MYLVGEKREWWLGRVAPGTLTSLRVPDDAIDIGSSFMRLAALPGATLSQQAARDPRSAITIAVPSLDLFTQRWTFSQRQLAAPQIKGVPMTNSRP